jgi:hypothetical protein
MLLKDCQRLLEGTRSGRPRIVNKWLVPQQRRGKASSSRMRMRCREYREVWFREKRCKPQRLRGIAIAQDSCVQGSIFQTFQNPRRERFIEPQLHARVQFPVPFQRLGQSRQHGGTDETYMERPDFACAHAAGFVEVALHVAKSAASALEERFTRGRELHRPRSTNKQGIPYDLFQFADLLRQRRLTQM